MSLAFLNRCVWRAASSGTGDFVVASAITGYVVPEDALNPTVVDSDIYTYFAQSDDLTQWEIGVGVYTTADDTLTRASVLDSSNSGSIVTFSAAPSVYMGGPLSQFVPSPSVLGQDSVNTSGLDYAYFGGYVSTNGVPISISGDVVTLADDTTNQVYYDADSAAVVAVDSGWPDPAPYIIPMAEVTTASGAVDSVVDVRGFLFAPAPSGGGGVTNPLSADLDVGAFRIISGDDGTDGLILNLTAGAGPAGYGGAVEIIGGNGDIDGGPVLLIGGNGTTGAGAPIQLFAGEGATDGGGLEIFSGPGNAGNGGTLSMGGGTGSVDGGSFDLAGGIGSSGNGGGFVLTGGQGDANGGSFVIQGGEGITGDGGNVAIRAGVGGTNPGQILMDTLPTSDPGVSGALWVDTGAGNVLKVSP